MFSKHIPYSQCRELIGKLEGLSNIYFRAKVKHICTLPEGKPANPQLFYTIDVLDEAITKGRQVAFEYCSYDVDKQLHPRCREDGSVREYVVNPYQMAATNGRYYLICNYDKYDNLAHYRIDRIRNIRLLDTPCKPATELDGHERLDLAGHMAEHIYMFTGETVRVKFRAKRYILGDIIDYFGTDAEFSDITEDELTVRAKVNAEEEPGQIYNSSLIIDDWTFDVEVSILDDADDIPEDRTLKDAIRRYKGLLGLTDASWAKE